MNEINVDEVISSSHNIESASPLTPEEEALLNQTIEEAHIEIPNNSNSLLIKESTSRFSSAIWYDAIKDQKVLLAGLGGIGSYVAFLLARLNIKELSLFDPDTVEEANLSGQLYSSASIGNFKTEATVSVVRNFANFYQTIAFNEEYTAESPISNIMICGFDNMAARKIFFNKWKSYVHALEDGYSKNCLYIDARLAAEELQVFAIQGNDERAMKEYEEKWLFSDSEADATICSYKQTTFIANMIGSIVVNLFVNFIANQCNPIIERDVPFFTSYNAETMYFKTIA